MHCQSCWLELREGILMDGTKRLEDLCVRCVAWGGCCMGGCGDMMC